MLHFITAGQNVVFAIVLALLVAFFLIELAGLLFGASISGVLGDIDLPDAGIDFDVDASIDIGVATKFLYWLKIGKVPLLILIVICMASFVISGYFLQMVCLWLFDFLLPALLATIAALCLSVPVVRVCGGSLARIMPRDETAAISHSELVGGRAVIVIGTAKAGSPAQARSTDRFGTTHYVMIEPDNPDEALTTGRDLLLVRYEGGRFYAIVHPDSGAE